MLTEESDDVTFLQDAKFLEEQSKRDKNVFFDEISSVGDKLLIEIKEKIKQREKEKNLLIKKILKKSKKHTKEELLTYSISDIREIYNEIKVRKSKLTTFLYFLFNVENK